MKLERIGGTAAQELTLPNGTVVLMSYSVPVACRMDGNYYRTNKKWSTTTSRHINRWLDGRRAMEVEQGFFDDMFVLK